MFSLSLHFFLRFCQKLGTFSVTFCFISSKNVDEKFTLLKLSAMQLYDFFIISNFVRRVEQAA